MIATIKTNEALETAALPYFASFIRTLPKRLVANKVVLGCALMAATAFSVQAQQLPNFASLVEQEGKAVVNIAVTSAVQPASLTEQPDLEKIPEHLRRFFQQPNPQQRQRQGSGVGSGFIVSDDGYILTNAHVVDDASNIVVRMRDRTEFNATLVGLDQLTDVALLKVDGNNLPVVRFADDEDVAVGEWVLAIGSPFGFDQSATQGIVSAVSRNLPSANYVPFIQTDVAVNPGNSGGPLFNTDGEVVGINSQIYSSTGGYQGLSFAIPINIALNVAEQLKESGQTSRGWLGVGIQDVNPALAESFGLDRVAGALITNVGDNSPADVGGLQEGDIILEFNNRPVNRSGELPSLVGAVRVGQTASLIVFRNGESTNLNVVIGKRGEEVAAITPDHNTLGMKLAAHNPDTAAIGSVEGVYVQELQPNSIAASAGIRLNDVIAQIGGVDIATPEEVVMVIDALPISKPVPVLVHRGDTSLFLTLAVPSTHE